VLRAGAQRELPGEDESAIENALALLGEIGDAAAIPPLLEFTSLENKNLSGAAVWALDRIVEMHSDEAARVIGEIAPSLGARERLEAVDRVLRHPRLDVAGALFARLAENLSVLAEEDRAQFFPLFLSAVMAARGRGGIDLAGSILRRNALLMTRKTREECEELIGIGGAGPFPLPPPPERPAWTVYDICSGNAYWEGNEDEEDDAPPAPVRRIHTPGRNDPCWCGSGKKYKKCHLDADQEASRGGGPQQAGASIPAGKFSGLRRRLGDFLERAVSKSDTRQAVKEFYESGLPADDSTSGALADWMMHDWIVPSFGRTVMQEYLRRHGGTLTPRERELVESWSRSYVGLYEVQEVREGIGIELKDLTANEVMFVHDVTSSKAFVRWDGLLARVVEDERGLELSGMVLKIPRRQLDPMLSWMEEDRARTGEPWLAYLRHHHPRIRRRPAELGEEWLSALQLSNTDGEELLFSKAVYRVLDGPALLAALTACPELNEDEEGKRYSWMKGPAGQEGRTVLGTVRLESDELVLECNSRARHERGQNLLSGIAGSALKHVRDEFTTLPEMKRRALQEPRPAGPGTQEIPPEVQHRLLTQLMEKHFAEWPDTALPALDGETPRDAVKTAEGRRRVSLILRDFENDEERKRKAGEPYYDISRLRAELGVEE
jgi:hypothetical protein